MDKLMTELPTTSRRTEPRQARQTRVTTLLRSSGKDRRIDRLTRRDLADAKVNRVTVKRNRRK